MRLYQIPATVKATVINIDNINFIAIDKDKEGWCVKIFFSQQSAEYGTAYRLGCIDEQEADDYYSRIVMEINDLANI